jgi:hypothetical protein
MAAQEQLRLRASAFLLLCVLALPFCIVKLRSTCQCCLTISEVRHGAWAVCQQLRTCCVPALQELEIMIKTREKAEIRTWLRMVLYCQRAVLPPVLRSVTQRRAPL